MTNRDASDMVVAFAAGFFLTILVLFLVDLYKGSQPDCPAGSVAIHGRCVIAVQPS